MPRNKLDLAFIAAACTHETTVARCACGQYHIVAETPVPPGLDGEPFINHLNLPGGKLHVGTFMGQPLVAECECEAISNMGNMLWGNRHPIAAFFRAMADAMQQDAEVLRGVLPGEDAIPSKEDR